MPVQTASPLRRAVLVPTILFVLTCLSTWLVGSFEFGFDALNWHPPLFGLHQMLWEGLKYAAPVMFILICHEMGHFIQARRYGVFASFPYFIPVPLPPIGTFGAVIAMEPRKGDRRALFDIGITGPLAGLVPTIVFLILGLYWSEVKPVKAGDFLVGFPLLLQWLSNLILPIPGPGEGIGLHPLAFAGWVGLLVTSLNLIPIGQLDGGHVLYGMLRTKAHAVATFLLLAAIAAVVFSQNYSWSVMLALLVFMGPRHPPTADDNVPLGPLRYILGVLVLAFVPIGFTPVPITIPDVPQQHAPQPLPQDGQDELDGQDIDNFVFNGKRPRGVDASAASLECGDSSPLFAARSSRSCNPLLHHETI